MAKQSAALVISPVMSAIFKIVENDRKSALTVNARVDAQVKSAWPVLMEHGAYTHSLKEIDALCKKKGLSDATNHHAKAFRASIIRVHGALPVAMGNEARRKDYERVKEIGADAWKEYETVRAANDAEGKPAHVSEALAIAAAKAKKQTPKNETAGAPADQPKPQVKTWREQLEQLLAVDGSRSVLEAIGVLADMVRADHSTLAQAKPLTQVRDRLAQVWKVADATPKTGTN